MAYYLPAGKPNVNTPGSFIRWLPLDTMRGMDKYEHRRQRLIELLESEDYAGYGGQSRLADDTGITADYISRMLYPKGKPGKKNIGEETMEKIEKALGLPRGWFDMPLGTPLKPEGPDPDMEWFGSLSKRDREAARAIVEQILRLKEGPPPTGGEPDLPDKRRPKR